MKRDDVLGLKKVPEEQIFYITFGQRYRTEQHPAGEWVSPSGYVVIVAPDQDAARAKANQVFGNEGWSMIYDHLDREAGRIDTNKHYPLGILAAYFV